MAFYTKWQYKYIVWAGFRGRTGLAQPLRRVGLGVGERGGADPDASPHAVVPHCAGPAGRRQLRGHAVPRLLVRLQRAGGMRRPARQAPGYRNPGLVRGREAGSLGPPYLCLAVSAASRSPSVITDYEGRVCVCLFGFFPVM